jgi:hypothetical protein
MKKSEPVPHRCEHCRQRAGTRFIDKDWVCEVCWPLLMHEIEEEAKP